MLKKLIIIFIKSYQLFISPILPKGCRFEPTCSNYAIIAITKYGIIIGSALTVKRLLRCHPFGGSGYDPVK
jgi:hypothetical protein